MKTVRNYDTPVPSQPQARRAADRDPAGGGSPVRRPSQPPSKSFALTPGEVVSNAGVSMRLYRKVLIAEAPGTAFVRKVRCAAQAGLAMPDRSKTRQQFRPPPEGVPVFVPSSIYLSGGISHEGTKPQHRSLRYPKSSPSLIDARFHRGRAEEDHRQDRAGNRRGHHFLLGFTTQIQ